jgi:hypothetical protein
VEKWRCIRCETLNDSHRKSCIVCDLERHVDEATTNLPIMRTCAYSGCKSLVAENQIYCDYHENAACPICKSALKAPGMDYCVNCGLALIKKNTSSLRKVDLTLKIVDAVAAIFFLTFLLPYIFYFN